MTTVINRCTIMMTIIKVKLFGPVPRAGNMEG